MSKFNNAILKFTGGAGKMGDLDENEINQLHPHANIQAVLDIIRFVGVFTFLINMMLSFAYLKSSKFASL